MEKITNVPYIKYLLEKYTTQAKKHFGQNFLVSEQVLETIIQTANIQDTDTILEIGPGLGVLTREICVRAKHLITIEKDPMMLQILKETILEKTPGAKEKTTIIHQDALRFDPATYPELKDTPYKLVANLPYNVATPILENFLVKSAHTPGAQPTSITVLIQKEVAEKASAKTGDLNVLALTLQPFATVKIIHHVPPGAFFPSPKVTSSVLHLQPHATPLLEKDLESTYFKLVHTGFSQKRKTLTNSLQHLMPKEQLLELFAKADVSPTIRPQNLSLEKWLTLASLATLS